MEPAPIDLSSVELQGPRDRLLLLLGTPTKTGEPTAAIIDETGVIHAVGVTGLPLQVLWYTTNERAVADKDVILGPELGHDVTESTYPVLLRDARRRRGPGLRPGDHRKFASDRPRVTCV